jgi:hypothetical protein
LTIVLAAGLLGYFHFFSAYQEGIRSGKVISVVKRGYIFKTYEGVMANEGLSADSSALFSFSIPDRLMADSLMHCQGRSVVVHYKEYKGALPWRGESRITVSAILYVKDTLY